jgi:signal transduction histidine kinase/ActR/RegA family two-component response regulator
MPESPAENSSLESSLLRILERERKARKMAERIIEQRSLELYLKNKELNELNALLEHKVRDRTAALSKQQDELKLALLKAEQAKKEKSDFLSIMSHEIRTPLNAIIGFSHVLLNDNPRKDQIQPLELLDYSSQNLMNLVNDILDFSKMEAGKVELNENWFSPSELIQRLAASMRPTASEKGLLLDVELDSDCPDFVKGDYARLNQVLINLVSNSLKFTATGKIVLKLSCQWHMSLESCQLRFAVIDTGIGVSKERQEHIFDVFSQEQSDTSLKYGGTGLGLAICRGFVRLMGGELKISSEKGVGSEFYFTIDLFVRHNSDSKSHKLDTMISLNTMDLKSARILLVEDNPINQKVTERFLSKWNALIFIAANGLEALKWLEINAVDLILMDIQMPIMDGHECTRQIRLLSDEKKAALPIIAMTADNSNETLMEVKQSGMNDFISKPFNPNDFAEKLVKHLEGFINEN